MGVKEKMSTGSGCYRETRSKRKEVYWEQDATGRQGVGVKKVWESKRTEK